MTTKQTPSLHDLTSDTCPDIPRPLQIKSAVNLEKCSISDKCSMKAVLAIVLTAVVCGSWLVASKQLHPPLVVCSVVCPISEPWMSVKMSKDSDWRYIKSYTCPPYDNKNWTTPNDACAKETTYKFPLVPKVANETVPVGEALSRYKGLLYLKEDPAPIMGAIGVLVNGVLIYGVGSPCFTYDCKSDGAPSDRYDAVESEGNTTDFCAGHASPQGEYHVHSGIGFKSEAGRVQCALPVDTSSNQNHSALLGYIFDGYPIYGVNSLGGVVPTDLDSCGGHTHVLDGKSTYHYHFYDNVFPWTIGCFTGCPEVSNNPRELKVAFDSKYGCGGPPNAGRAAQAGAIITLCALVISVVWLAH